MQHHCDLWRSVPQLDHYLDSFVRSKQSILLKSILSTQQNMGTPWPHFWDRTLKKFSTIRRTLDSLQAHNCFLPYSGLICEMCAYQPPSKQNILPLLLNGCDASQITRITTVEGVKEQSMGRKPRAEVLLDLHSSPNVWVTKSRRMARIQTKRNAKRFLGKPAHGTPWRRHKDNIKRDLNEKG